MHAYAGCVADPRTTDGQNPKAYNRHIYINMRPVKVFVYFGFALICHTRYRIWLAIFEWRLMMEYVDAFQKT
jgi:hypothetical protein